MGDEHTVEGKGLVGFSVKPYIERALDFYYVT